METNINTQNIRLERPYSHYLLLTIFQTVSMRLLLPFRVSLADSYNERLFIALHNTIRPVLNGTVPISGHLCRCLDGLLIR